MAGKQIYTSSLFVQSGSVAKFESGITSSEAIIAGTVYANQYLDLNGNPVSSGGTQAVFFAGSGSGVSASNPFSQDHFFTIEGNNSVDNPLDSTLNAVIKEDLIRIETTSSLSFTPNFYNFMKIGNNNEDLITVQQGTNPTYIVDNSDNKVDERKAGTHRYIIYAADTNPGGSTHQVFHTVTLESFVNEPPILISPTGSTVGSPVTMSLDHDSNSKDLILHFTNSFDPNQERGDEDWIATFLIRRDTTDPDIGSDADTSDGYTLNLNHTTKDEISDADGKPTISIASGKPGLAQNYNPNILHITTSLTNYDATNAAINTITFSEPQEERFFVKIEDNYVTNEIPGIATGSVTMSIVPPPTSSISNIKVLFSGTNNTDGDNETLNNSHTHTILYDRTQSLDSAEIANLDKRYTSSIVKVKVSASITEPPGFNVVPEDHTTRLIIQSSSTNVINSTIDTQVLGAFLFSGSNTNETVTASHHSNTLDGSYTPLDENHFYVLTESIDVNTKSDRDIFYGAHTNNIDTINKTNYIQHGNHNHYEAFLYSVGSSDKLTLKACPEIKIDDIVVEVESGSFATNTGHPNLTSSLLYNLTSSISSSQTSSLFSNFTPGQELYNQYVSQSIVRLRIKSKITEPFGPDHNEITASFKVSGDNTIGTTTEAIIREAKFSISPEDGFNDLGSTDIDIVNTTLNLSSLLDSKLTIDSDDYVDVTLEVEKIEVRGDLGKDQSDTEIISDFNLGGKSFGDNIQLKTDLDDKLKADWNNSTPQSNKLSEDDVANYAEYEPLSDNTESTIFGDHNNNRTFNEYGRKGDGDWNVFITAWTGSIGGNRIVDLNQTIGNQGTINVSFNPNDGVTYNVYDSERLGNNYYQFRITFKATYETTTTSDTDITEVTDFESIKIPFNTESAYNFTYTTDHDYSEFSGKELLVSSYTSSWYEFIQKPGVNQFSAVFSSQSNAGTNLNTSTSQSAEVSMSVVPSIKINDLVYETETYGYSGEAATDTSVRTVLYGDAHFTNDGTGSGESGFSWRNHETASRYASHSVSRFRVKGIITEPVGPSINGQISASLITFRSDNLDATYYPFTTIGIPIDYTTNSPTNNAAESDNDISSSITTLVDNQLVTVFTSSWTGSQLTLPDTQRSAGDEQDFTISGSIIYVPDSTYEGSNNGIEILNPTTNTIKVKQTPEITVNSIKLVSETYGYSEIETQDTTRTVLYGDAQTTNSTSASKSWENHNLSIPYASQSVSRFKLTVKVTEPLGPLHYNSNYRIWDIDNNSPRYSNFNFNTGSSELADFDWVDYKLSATYTSSWIGLALPTTLNSNFVRRLRPRIFHSPSNDPQTSTTFNSDGTDVNVIDTPPAEIRDLVVESETEGYSGVATTDTTSRTVLYGQTTTNTGTGSGETGASLVGHSLADEFAKKSVSRFRYRFKVVEPIGPLHHETNVNPKMVNGASVESSLNSKTFNTSSTEVIDEDHFDPNGTSTDSNRLIYTVTSSFSGSNLDSNSTSGENYIYRILSNNISHIATNENTNTYTATNGTYNFVVKDTPQTLISEVFYETETFGYSGIITQNTTRSILYGDNHETNDGTGSGDSGFSWRNHDLAVTYASHSVLRTKVRAKVTEPLGPLHHGTSFNRKFIRSSNSSTTHLSTLTFNTNSLGSISGNTELDSNNRRVTRYTSSFDGVQLTSTLQNGDTYTFDGFQTHNPSTEDPVTVVLQPAAKSKILVKDTPDTQIIIGDVDIETFGESGIAASNHESSTSIPDTHTRVVLHAEQNTRPTGSSMANSLFTGSAVLRTNVEAKIIEPLGPLHHAASMSVFYDASDSSEDDKSGPLINFSTESGDILSKTYGYDLEGRLTASYTSSFTGSELPPMPHYEMKILNDNITFNPSTENGFTRTEASFKPTNFIKVEQGANHTINNFFIEVENSNSGSNVGNRIERSTNVLHGNTGSETNHSVNIGYPDSDDRDQLVSFRVLSSVVYPPAEEHFTSKFTVSKSLFTSNLPFTSTTVASKILNLNTGSGNSDVYLSQILPTTTQGTTVNYTSSWFPVLFDAQGNTGEGIASTTNIIGYESVDHTSASYVGETDNNSFDLIRKPDILGISNPLFEINLTNYFGSFKWFAFGGNFTGEGNGATLFVRSANQAITGDANNLFDGTFNTSYQILVGESALSSDALSFNGFDHDFRISIDLGTDLSKFLAIAGLIFHHSSTDVTNLTSLNNINYKFFARPLSEGTDSNFNFIDVDKTDNTYQEIPLLLGGNIVQNVTRGPFDTSDNSSISSEAQINTANNTLLSEQSFNSDFTYRYYHILIKLNPQSAGTMDLRMLEILGVQAQLGTSTNNAEKNTYLVSSSFDGVFSDSGFSFTPGTLSMTSNTISVHATGAFSSSITADFGTGSLISASFFNSSDSEKSLYVIYPENGSDYQEIQVFPENVTTTPPTFTSESNLAFPNNLNITASSNNVNFSFANDGSYPLTNDPTSGTASIFIYNPSNYGHIVDSSLITLGIEDQETGSGFFQVSQSIFVIPKAPQTMSGDFDMVIGAHPAEMEDKFYFGLLASESLVNYSGSDADKPQNPTSIVSSSRILFVSTSAGYNYSMSLFTHTNNNPEYSTHATNEAFNFGDSGSLELKINGTSKTQVNLQSNFNASNKNTTQTLSGYDNDYSPYTFNNGTASFAEGKLIITKVAPFNTVSQSISKGGYSLNNGYQGFGVKIELDDRIRAGYNHLELIHNIADGFTQSMNVFDWYYNDGVETPSIKPNETMSYTEISNTPATHSLSGVSYFKDQTPFTASISNIYNLANKVYNHDPNNTFTDLINTLITHDGELAVKTDSAIMSNVSSPTPITHKVDPNLSDSRKGLRFHEGDNHFIPTAQSTASIKYELSTTLPSNVDPIQGKSYDLELRFQNRTKTSEHSYSAGGTNPLNSGRFMKSGSNLNSLTDVTYFTPNNQTASFFDEDRRWSRTSLLASQSNNPNTMGGNNHDYTFWVSSSRANYDSVQNISSTNDLQQLYTGKLIFPSESYDGTLPNTVDYSTVTENEQREYYTAIKADTSLSSKNFTLIVSGNLNKNDFPFSANQNALDGNINIFVKLPGPINTDFSSNDGNTPGTGFGSVTGTKGGLSSFVKDENCKIAKGLDTTLTGPNQVAFKFSFGQSSAEFCNDVILVRVAMSGSIHPTGSIKQISIQSR